MHFTLSSWQALDQDAWADEVCLQLIYKASSQLDIMTRQCCVYMQMHVLHDHDETPKQSNYCKTTTVANDWACLQLGC